MYFLSLRLEAFLEDVQLISLDDRSSLTVTILHRLLLDDVVLSIIGVQKTPDSASLKKPSIKTVSIAFL